MFELYRKVLSFSIVLANIYFLKTTYTILWGTGQGGLGLLLLPITLSINFLLIPALLNFKKTNRQSTFTSKHHWFNLVFVLVAPIF